MFNKKLIEAQGRRISELEEDKKRLSKSLDEISAYNKTLLNTNNVMFRDIEKANAPIMKLVKESDCRCRAGDCKFNHKIPVSNNPQKTNEKCKDLTSIGTCAILETADRILRGC